MLRRSVPYLGVLLATLIIAWAVPRTSAEELGKMRVQRMNGTWLVGDVEDVGDAYKITTGKGIVVTLKKNEVKAILPLEEEAGAEPKAPANSTEANSFRREVSDEEIQELVNGITIEAEDIVETPEMLQELTLDEEGVKEMLRLAGGDRTKNVLEKPHFVLLYTSTKDQAQQLAARLESIYRWNLKFMSMLGLPLVRPDHKLEIFYFGTHKEFEAYSVNIGGGPSGALGFYTPNNNRSAFFELSTYPPIANWLEQAKDTKLPWKERQYVKNKLTQWVEFNNITVIQHEAGHHIHFNIGLFPRDVFLDQESYDSLPRWLVEGTTMMFEFPPTKVGASLGTTNHGRLDEFDQIYGRKNKDRRLSPQQLKSFVLDNSIFLRGGGSTYSLGWALVNYLWNKKRDKYAEYAKIISTREPGTAISYTQREKEFEDCFGRLDEKWIENWYVFLDDLQLKKSVLPPSLHP